jgi:hypothetical protein
VPESYDLSGKKKKLRNVTLADNRLYEMLSVNEEITAVSNGFDNSAQTLPSSVSCLW